MATVKGTAKVDKFTVNVGSVIVVTGKKPTSSVISKNGNNKIFGAAGKDTFNIKGGKHNYIYGDKGNDTITVTGKIGSGNKIYGDDAKNKVSGKDTFTIKSGKKNYFYGGRGADTFNVNGGTANYIYGGAGNDVIVIGKNSKGKAIVKDFSVKKGNKDTVKVTGGAVKSIAVSGKNMIVKGGKSASVTLQKAKAKTFTVTDTLGKYTVAGANVKLALGNNYKGTLKAASFITTVDARSNANAITINGNAKNNTIYGGSGVNTLYGGDGSDTLYGGTGNDIFYGGAGKDKFNYTSGISVIKDFAVGETLSVSNAVTNVSVNGDNIILTAGTGSLTVEKGKGKLTEITEAGKKKKLYITKGGGINGSNYDDIVAAVGVIPNDYGAYGYGSNNVYGGKGNDSLIVTDFVYGSYFFGGDGNDTIYINGGSGNYLYGGSDLRIDTNPVYTSNKNTFVFSSGNATISDFKAADALKLEKALDGVTVEQYTTSDPLDPAAPPEEHNRFVLLCGSGNTLEVEEAIGKLTRLNEKGRTIVLPSVTMDGTTAAIVLDKSFASRQLSVVMHTENVVIDASSVGKGAKVSVSSDPGQSVTFTGGAGKDVIYVQGNGSSTLYGGTGDDEMTGGAGNDELHGGAGNDAVFGGYGDDRVYGDAGNDRLYGSYGSDILSGGDGNDMLYGGLGDDILTGGNDSDVFVYEGGNDTITDYHNYGPDSQQDKLEAEGTKITAVTYNANADNAHGKNAGDVTLTTENGGSITLKDFWDDSYALITDERGNYALRMFENGTEPRISLGEDILGSTFSGNTFDVSGMTFKTDFGSGINMLEIDADGANSCIGVIRGNDSVWTNIYGCNVYDGNNYNYLYAGNAGAGLYGGSGKDYLIGSNALDQLYGNEGDDHLKGGAGNDELRGGDGNDTLYGGVGNDTLYGDDGNDTLDGGVGNDMLYGDDGNDTLYGGVGDDTLYGDAGGDFLEGGAGNNIMYAGKDDNASDMFKFYSDCNGTNTIYDFCAGNGSNSDVLYFGNGIQIQSQVGSGNDSVISLSTGGSIRLIGCAGKYIRTRFN